MNLSISVAEVECCAQVCTGLRMAVMGVAASLMRVSVGPELIFVEQVHRVEVGAFSVSHLIFLAPEIGGKENIAPSSMLTL